MHQRLRFRSPNPLREQPGQSTSAPKVHFPPITHGSTGCVVTIEADPLATPKERYRYSATLDGKPIGYAPGRFPSAKQALDDATDFIADAFNLFGQVIVKSRPALTLIAGGLAAEAA